MVEKFHSNLYLVSDLENTAEFYKQAGFNIETSDSVVKVKLGDFTLALMDENKVEISNEAGAQPKGLGIYTYVEVDDVDKHYELIKQNGIEPRSEPRTWPWGKREFVVKDPDGFKLCFFSSVAS